MINLSAIVSVAVGTGILYLIVRYTIGLLITGFDTDFDYVMAWVIIGVIALVIVGMILLDAKGYLGILL